MIHYFVLRPEDLSREDVRKAASEGLVVLMKEDNDSEVQQLIDGVFEMLRRCRSMLTPSYSMRNVRVYLNHIAQCDNVEFCSRLCNPAQRQKYVCHLLGAMLQHGIFSSSPLALARKLGLSARESSIRKYISDGRGIQSLLEILQQADDAVTENPYFLCSRY